MPTLYSRNPVVKIKKSAGRKFRVCLVSGVNGKLILQGEPVNRLKDANKVANDLRDAWNDKRNCIPVEPIEILPLSHRWPVNAGKIPQQ